MGWLEVLVLAVVQGVTEFLPVSSSGHLVVAAALLEEFPQEVLDVSIVLHLGTLLSVIVFYWHRLWRLLGEDRRVIPLLIVGTLPAVVVTLAIKIVAPEMEILESPLLAGLMFPLTGLLLIAASRRLPGTTDYTDMTYRQVLAIGALQAVAILPGISRSGSTIVAGLLVGLRRESATTFAFLLAVPAIGGAGLLQAVKMLKGASLTTAPTVLAAGALVSFLVGLAALWWLIRLVQQGRLAWFAWWLIPLGIAVTAWQASKLMTTPVSPAAQAVSCVSIVGEGCGGSSDGGSNRWAIGRQFSMEYNKCIGPCPAGPIL